jgi:hypothetical protein
MCVDVKSQNHDNVTDWFIMCMRVHVYVLTLNVVVVNVAVQSFCSISRSNSLLQNRRYVQLFTCEISSFNTIYNYLHDIDIVLW